MRFSVLLIGYLLIGPWLFPAPCLGRSVETSQTVSVIVVEPMISLIDDAEALSLTLDRGVTSASSDTRVVNYHVYGNVIPTTPVSGVISGRISSGQEGIEIQADVGGYANRGTDNHALLREHQTGFQTIGTERVPLADKGASSGGQGGILNGTIPIAWKATANGNLSAGAYPVTLTVTLKDA